MDILSEYLANGRSFLNERILEDYDWAVEDPATHAIIFSLRSSDYSSSILLKVLLEIGKRCESPCIQTVSLARFYDEFAELPIEDSLISLFAESLLISGSQEHGKLVKEKLNQCFQALIGKYGSLDLLPFARILHPYKDILENTSEIFMLNPEDMDLLFNYTRESPDTVLDLIEKIFEISKDKELHHSGALSAMSYNALVHVIKTAPVQAERIGKILRNIFFVLSADQYNTLSTMYEDLHRPRKVSVVEYIEDLLVRIKEKERVNSQDIAQSLINYIEDTDEQKVFEAVDAAISRHLPNEENHVAWRVINKACYIHCVFSEYNQAAINMRVKDIAKKTRINKEKINFENRPRQKNNRK